MKPGAGAALSYSLIPVNTPCLQIYSQAAQIKEEKTSSKICVESCGQDDESVGLTKTQVSGLKSQWWIMTSSTHCCHVIDSRWKVQSSQEFHSRTNHESNRLENCNIQEIKLWYNTLITASYLLEVINWSVYCKITFMFASIFIITILIKNRELDARKRIIEKKKNCCCWGCKCKCLGQSNTIMIIWWLSDYRECSEHF